MNGTSPISTPMGRPKWVSSQFTMPSMIYSRSLSAIFLHLQLNNKTCIRPVRLGAEFVGFRVWSTHVKLRKKTAKKMMFPQPAYKRTDRLYFDMRR